MKTKGLFLLLFLSLFVQAKAQNLPVEQLHQDFDLFKKALEEVHPEMYRYTAKPTFDSLFLATKTRLNQPMSQHTFFITMMPLVTALHDGHIKWIPSGKDEHYPFFTDHLFPLKLYFLGEKAWILDNYGSEPLPIGSQIVSINGKSISSISQTLLPNMTFSDGYTINGKYEDLNHFFPGFYATHFGPSTVFEVVYLEENQEKVARISAVSEKTIKAHIEKHKPAPQKPFRLAFKNDKTAVITIERFWDDKKEQDYKDFLKDSFRQLKQKNIQNLVLDVRNNEGGNEPYGVLLYEYIAQKPFLYYDHISVKQKKDISFPAWRPKIYTIARKLFVKKRGNGYVFTFQRGLKEIKPKRDAFTGNVYVLINGNSFSVTSEFSARAHADKRAVFIGQETGGGYQGNASGIFTVLQLPNTKIELGIPMFGFHMAHIPAHIKHGQGIVPDYVVEPTATDILNNYDRALNETMQLIQKQSYFSQPVSDQTK